MRFELHPGEFAGRSLITSLGLPCPPVLSQAQSKGGTSRRGLGASLFLTMPFRATTLLLVEPALSSKIQSAASVPAGMQVDIYCCCSVAKSCLTLCDPMDCGTPGACSNARPRSQWCYLAISSSATVFFCL